jgi:SAM-dependent methyltransferase
MVTSQGYVHGHHESVLRSHRWRTAANSAAYLLPHLRPGQVLLDVGSGPGTITAELAGLVAPGAVTALEVSESALAVTRTGLGAGHHVTLIVGDVHDLDLPDDSFDVVHAHQVLQHVADPVKALREMRRVCKPDGLVAARDGDYAGFTWWPRLPGLDEWLRLYEGAARQAGGEPDAGRRLLGWAQAAGFAEITATSSTWCYATPSDREWWGGRWADRITQSDVADRLLYSGMASRTDLEHVAQAWREWAGAEDGWMSVLHGEVICRA